MGSPEKYEPRHIQELNNACHKFLNLCQTALHLEFKSIQPHQRQFHIEIEKGFYDTKEFFLQYLKNMDEYKIENIIHDKRETKINVMEWSVDQVADWIKKHEKLNELETFIRENRIDGKLLLQLELNQLCAYKVPLALAVVLKDCINELHKL